MVGIEQPLTVTDYSMAIGIGVTRKRNVESVFQTDHARHRVHR